MNRVTGIAPAGFAEDWVAAWNARDLDRILSHYAAGVVFVSPVAASLTGCGTVIGKAALEAYWRAALDRAPDLHFSLDRVLEGAGALTLLYRNHRGQHVAETCEFDAAGRVVRSVACYASGA
ncbi:MAG: nuclear transport factor 2 family protein [Novosphingobium sp.]|uniref:nuclear transport factor 2 family protein n=1 Tax=Novosphingobium sp. TaxID=1874826 RepID=UPI0032B753D2